MNEITPNVCVYNSQNISKSLKNSLASDSVFYFDDSGFGPELIKNIKSSKISKSPIIVINGLCNVPMYWQERLLQPLKSQHGISVCSALSCQHYELSPVLESTPFSGTVLELDQLIYILQKPEIIHTPSFNSDCFIVQSLGDLESLNKRAKFACNNLLIQSAKQTQLIDIKEIGDQKPLPAHALAELHWKIQNTNFRPRDYTNSYPLFDNKPIILHITMSWGGGVQKWIEDYTSVEKNCHHLILSSSGELYRQSHGEQFELVFAENPNWQVAKYELQSPIKQTAIQNQEYKQNLNQIIDQFDVKAIMVSSLIGHSMQCLETGLPTIKVLHDYFPSWPSLTADLESKKLTDTELNQALEKSKLEPFGEITKAEYLEWKKHLHAVYQNTQLIAPSQSVANNIRKIDQKLSNKDIKIIPHGIKPFSKLVTYSKNSKFTILVLGRISPPKGQEILEGIINGLDESYQFALIGAGHEGKKYLHHKNVEVIKNYEQAQIHQLLEDTQPDIALITSITSETFNYTLSELQSARICVLSTAFGALKERISDGETGYLLEPKASEFIKKIKNLKQHPEHIEKIQSKLTSVNFETIDTMVVDYRKQFSLGESQSQSIKISNQSKNILANQLLQKSKMLNRVSRSLYEQEETTKERTKWAKTLSKTLETANKNIGLEREQVTHLKETIQIEQKRYATELNSLKETIQIETTRMSQEINKLNEDYQNLSDEYSSLIQSFSESQRDLDQVNNELNKVYSSRSWRITKPIRSFTTWSRHKRNAAKFRYAQLKSLPTRAIRSLKTRGYSGTFSLIKNRLSNDAAPQLETQEVQLETEFKPIAFKKETKAKVSVIIPVYNHFSHTYNCLKSLSKLKDACSFEVIVVDDCSTDNTQKQIQLVDNLVYHRQTKNGGFIESCNTGAKLANGQYLMFLNNDTVVHKNWLDSLIKVFDDFPDAGLVGSKLVYPNNQLQEAGGIVFSDASGWNYGRLGNPDEPWYNHIREVDYCSGASILIKNETFKQLGYFDERYKPAYYEDTDLAFAVRTLGKKVYIQPESVVTHFEGISSGTDLSSGTKKYQVVNQQKFKEKWAKQLSKQPKSGTDIELCRIHSQPKRILIFDACTPTPDQDSGSLRMLNLIKILKELKYHVVFMAENLSFEKGYTTDLQQLGVECIYTPTITNPLDYLKEKGKYFDEIILSRYYVAEPVMPFIREYCPKAKLIFDTVDLHFVRERRMAELENDKKLAKIAEETRIKELAVAKACDTTLVVSPYEVGVLEEEIPDSKVKVLTNIHEIYGCRKPYSERKDIMFIGGYQHTPNVDAVEWFVESIFPLIEKQITDLKFHIVGSRAPKHIQNMARDNIVFHGFVEDIEPFMDDIRIAVAPLRYGAGVKGKVNMSMSYGQPVVGTKCAVEGMYAQEGVDVLMAEKPEEFASQIIRLYSNESLWNTISKGGLANVQNYFSFEAAKSAIQEIL